MKPVKVGTCGLGTVGGNTFNVLERNAEEIARRTECGIEVTQIAVRRPNLKYDIDATPIIVSIFDAAHNPKTDMVAEPIGGYTLAHELVFRVIENGKHVVTVNKALIAAHGNEIFARTREKGVIVVSEVVITGGIPMTKAIREGLSANRINWLARTINGTDSSILSEMRKEGCTFPDVLTGAQAPGYAKTGPTFDTEGIDAAHKLTILASITFDAPLQFDKTHTEGIPRLTSVGVNYADALGHRIKHLGVTRRTESGSGLCMHLVLIPSDRLIANADGVMNTVMVSGDAVGSTLYYGAGAGMGPTASSMVADLVDAARAMTSDPENRVSRLASQPDALFDHPILPIKACESVYHLHIQVKDRPGVLAQVVTVLSKYGINIESTMQKEAEEQDGLVPMILVTHQVAEQRINDVIAALEALEGMSESVVRIRVEQLS